jgi:hypothetical protein
MPHPQRLKMSCVRYCRERELKEGSQITRRDGDRQQCEQFQLMSTQGDTEFAGKAENEHIESSAWGQLLQSQICVELKEERADKGIKKRQQ